MLKHFKKNYHPFLIAIYPILNLLDANLGQVTWSVVIRPIILVLIFTTILLAFLSFMMSSWERAGLLTSIFLILFYSYGHIYSLTEGAHFFGILIGRHRYLFSLWLGLLGLGAYISLKRPNLSRARSFMNIGAVALLLIPFLNLIVRGFVNRIEISQLPTSSNTSTGNMPNKNDILPDIYYIILDQYPRQDVLEEMYGFDNSEFISHLTELGFYVADRSFSNYSQTELSLASSLNFQYLSELGVSEETFGNNRAPLWTLIKDNAARNYFEQMGYVIIAYETGYSWSQWETADFYLGPRSGFTESLSVKGSLTGFETLLIHKSALVLVEDLAPFARGNLIPNIYGPGRGSYDRVTYTFESLTQVAEHENPVFVFAHILSPHPPYVFSPTGEFIGTDTIESGSSIPGDQSGEEDAIGFIRSVQFVNNRIIEVIEDIQSFPGNPIIILQSDHGIPGSTHGHRMSILNAYHLPYGGEQLLYDSISPVNTFRLILKHYFNEDIELFEDISLFSTSYDNPYKYAMVETSRP
jgi:hypothetical protein